MKISLSKTEISESNIYYYGSLKVKQQYYNRLITLLIEMYYISIINFHNLTRFSLEQERGVIGIINKTTTDNFQNNIRIKHGNLHSFGKRIRNGSIDSNYAKLTERNQA